MSVQGKVVDSQRKKSKGTYLFGFIRFVWGHMHS